MGGASQLGSRNISLKIFNIFISLVLIRIFPLTCTATTIDCIIPSQPEHSDYKHIYESELFLSSQCTAYSGAGVLESLYVAPTGWYLLMFSDGVMHYLDVYNHDCQHQIQLIFKESGSILATFDNQDNNIVVFPIRRKMLIKVDKQGDFISASAAMNESAAISELSALQSFNKHYNEKTYSFQGKTGWGSNQQEFTIVDNTGNCLFIYAPSQDTNPWINGAFIFVAFVVLVSYHINCKVKE